MNLVLTGLNHKTAPVALREKIAFRPEDFPKAFTMLRHFGNVRESAILSTCNRTEIYAVMEQESPDVLLANYIGEFHKIPPERFSSHLYTKEGMEAARHLFFVSAGLDSLVIGEDQILGQVKQTFKTGQELKSLGTILHRLFQSAIEAGKRIRNETALGEDPGSVGEAAVELARQIFGNLEGKSILVLGAGEMGRVVVEALMESGISQIMVCSRTFESAKQLAEQLNGTPFTLEAMHHPLGRADIVITAVASDEPVLRRAILEEAMRERRHAPLFIVDIAVPRNVEEGAARMENLFLYNIDDLKQIVQAGDETFQKELATARAIVEEELGKFYAWHQAREIIPTIKALTRKVEAIKEQELQRVLSRFPDLGEKERSAVQGLAHSLVNKILHLPLVKLKNYATHPLGHDYLEVARGLFGLDDENDA